jgi:hypothetical protein
MLKFENHYLALHVEKKKKINNFSIQLKNLEKKKLPGVVAHACNPTYLGDGDQENLSSRIALTKVSQSPSQSMSWIWWSHLWSPPLRRQR